ncbi:MAG: CDP-diacylglycerol--glycerol-3-phosphate 3-phosphatidyltransferase [Oceanicaulis sp.]
MNQLPNAVSIARAIAGPFGAFLLLMSASAGGESEAVAYGLASAVIFVVAAVSDWLDGWLARRLDVESPLGALLDPIADKLLVGPYLIAYVIISGFDIWLAAPVAVIVVRDMVVTGLRLRSGAPETLKVSYDAKVKTAIQMVLTAAPFVLVLAGLRDVGVWFYYWVGGVWFLAVLTVWTALPYWRAARS